jgi:hypothetical protein
MLSISYCLHDTEPNSINTYVTLLCTTLYCLFYQFIFLALKLSSLLAKKKKALTARPTAPNPNTATVEPSFTFAVFHAAPTPMYTFNNYTNQIIYSLTIICRLTSIGFPGIAHIQLLLLIPQ